MLGNSALGTGCPLFFGKKCSLSVCRREGTGCKFPLVLPTLSPLQTCCRFLLSSPWPLGLCSLVLIAMEEPSAVPGSFPALACSRTWDLCRELCPCPEPSSFSGCPKERVALFLWLLSLPQPIPVPHSHPPHPHCSLCSLLRAWHNIAGHHWGQSCFTWFLPEKKNPAGYQLDLKQFHWIYCGLSAEPSFISICWWIWLELAYALENLNIFGQHCVCELQGDLSLFIYFLHSSWEKKGRM